jgi:hypothetical protein
MTATDPTFGDFHTPYHAAFAFLDHAFAFHQNGLVSHGVNISGLFCATYHVQCHGTNQNESLTFLINLRRFDVLGLGF